MSVENNLSKSIKEGVKKPTFGSPGSGSGLTQKDLIRPDPDPQHCCKPPGRNRNIEISRSFLEERGGVMHCKQRSSRSVKNI